MLWKRPKQRQACLSGILGALETSETLTGMLIRHLRSFGNVQNPGRKGYQTLRGTSWAQAMLFLKCLKPRQEGLLGTSRSLLDAQVGPSEVSETWAGMLNRPFGYMMVSKMSRDVP